MRNLRGSLTVLLSAVMFLSIMAGVARAGYIQVFERNTNADLTIWTYDTLPDLVQGWSAPSATNYQVPASLWSPDWSMVGIAYDGTKYIQVFDNNTTAALSIFTYDTLADLLLGYNAPLYTHYPVDASVWKNADWSAAGLTYDGSQYILGFDSNTDAALSIFTFDTFTDLVDGPTFSSNWYPVDASVWQPNSGPQWNMVGLAYVVPEPTSLLLLGTGLGVLGLAAYRRRRK